MIPTIYDKTGNTKYGELVDCIKGIVIEVRNGLFQAEVQYCLFSPHWDKLIRGNIIIADANDILKNQKFRINKVSKPINGQFTVKAKHISYDMARDIIEGLEIESQSCEYCLNQIFRSSQFSQHFKGHSDIINSQNFKIKETNPFNAIAGTEGSIIDTFGTGAELLRDNTDIYVLNKRGHDNGVTIEYGKNLTGITLDEDDSNMITRIKGYAKYSDENGEEVIVYTTPKYIDSPRVLDYETPFVEAIDFSNNFEDDEVPTPEKIKTLVEKYFTNNKCDLPKTNAKISFIPLSKCVGYEDIEDKISLCDTVTIKDYRYNYETKAKVIKTTYNFLTDRYESMEVGEPRSSLGDIIGGNTTVKGEKGDKGDKGDPGADGNIGDFPDSLPTTPILTSTLYGFASIGLDWTFENKVYYNYELYASKTKDFTPNVFDLIFEGQASTFLFQAKPNETWYFRVCALNTHGKRTEFSNQIAVTTTKVSDLSNYVESAAIGDALIGTLSLDRGWVGELRGNYIDAKQLSVTDGKGKRTFDIDSFGNVNLDVTSLKIHSTSIDKVIDDSVNTTVNSILDIFKNGVISDVEKKILKEKKENLLREKADILAQTEIIKQSEMLVNTSELIDLKQSESNYISSIDNLVAIIDKLLEGGKVMASLVVNPSVVNVTNVNQNTVTVNFTCDKTLTDVKLSTNSGIAYKDKMNMTQTSATFDITGMSNNSYSCKLKGYYEEADTPEPPSTTSGVKVEPTSVSIKVDETADVTISFGSDVTNKSIEYMSSSGAIASISDLGNYKYRITGVGQGKTSIRFRTSDGKFETSCSVTVTSSSTDGESTSPEVSSEYAQSCTSEYILDKMYPMGQAHEAIPSGLITDTWKYNSRWENQYRPTAVAHSCGQSGCPGTGQFKALGCWSNVYRVEGTPFSTNTGVEMKDIKVYGWYNGKWELVQHLPVPNGNFYPESFGGDVNKYFADSVKQTSTSKTIILREKNKIDAMNWNTGQLQTENCMYHPFSDVKTFDTKYEYIYTCIDLRKVLWDANGVDDRDQTHYCSNCGGDWWLAEGLMFHDSWQHNKGVCQPKMIEITNEWRRFSMTTVPQNWQYGFPE